MPDRLRLCRFASLGKLYDPGRKCSPKGIDGDGITAHSSEEARVRRLIEPNDLVLTGIESVCALSARFLSPERCSAMSRAIAALSLGLQPGKKRRGTDLYRRIIGPAQESMPNPNKYLHGLIATHVEESIMTHRLGLRPDWRPDITVAGADRVEALRMRGGIVFWILPFEFVVLLLRLVAHDRGWPYHHVSLWTHGPSPTRYGRAMFNRRVQRTEDQYSSRIVIPPKGAAAALEQVAAVLRSGGMVGFRGLGRAKRPIRYPFLAGRIDLAMGAPVSAMRHGAALILVVARKEGVHGFHLDFEPLPYGLNERPEDLGRRFVERMEKVVLRSPTLWSVMREQCMPDPLDKSGGTEPPCQRGHDSAKRN